MRKCPKCGCSAFSRQGSEMVKYRGEDELVRAERRKCKYCGCKYTFNPRQREQRECPYCKSTKTRKEGIIEGGHKYKCNNCGKHFRDVYEKGKSPAISDYIKQKVRLYARGGFSQRFIANMFGIGATSVRRILKENEDGISKTH